MKALLFILLLTFAAMGCGLSILRRTTILRGALMERLCFALAIGLGIAAYGVYVLGLLGFLKFVPVTFWWLVLGLLGCLGWESFLKEWKQNRLSPATNSETSAIWFWVFALTATACGIFAIAACFRPPTGTEWDAIAYHLANPKVFLHDGRISILPTDHHSNFPFVMEMLFAVGLLYDGYALANLFHLVTAIGLVTSIVSFSARMFGKNAGYAAGLLLMTTPLVLWEASVAYTELGLALYASIAAFAIVSARSENETSKCQEWMRLAGLCLGFALGIKYLAILPLLVLIGYALVVRLPRKLIVQFALIAMVVGSPWYIKNWVQMRNPVYPYLASIFSNSKYWSADRAKTYEERTEKFSGIRIACLPTTRKSQRANRSPWCKCLGASPANSELYANPRQLRLCRDARRIGFWSVLLFGLIEKCADCSTRDHGNCVGTGGGMVPECTSRTVSALNLSAVVCRCGLCGYVNKREKQICSFGCVGIAGGAVRQPRV